MKDRERGSSEALGAVKPWYEEAFGELYPIVYAHRDLTEAEAIARLVETRRTLAGKRFLDLGCGAGRFASVLHQRGAAVIGLDLSRSLLRLVPGNAPGVPRVRADMRRVPLDRGSVDGVFSVFTSFGYFADPQHNLEVIREVARVLAAGGFYFLDLGQPAWVRRRLVPQSTRRNGPWRIEERRRLEDGGRWVVKDVRVRHTEDGREKQWRETVRLYEREEMQSILEDSGFRLDRVWGDYDGAQPGADRSRLIFLAERGRTP
ncbi:MAG: methyltransferase domain-containing protein [Candidatus Eisenbacteria bacterium]|nr:methyltransferase domain-containing protein [Candidatus Eisenbacteria bacterium]